MIEADYTKTFLLPPSIEDWVPADHPVRFIREFVNSLQLDGLGLKMVPEKAGRPPYSPRLLLMLWLYGYESRIRSSRKIETACKEMLPMIWLAGGLQPDHNTIARFWTRNREVIRQAFRQSVQTAADLGLVSFALHAVDGTKIQAAGSIHKVFTQEQLEKLIDRLDTKMSELEAQIECNESSEDDREPARLSEELQERKALKAAIEKSLAARADEDAAAKRHLQETDARLMKGCGLGYNAQTVIDEKANVIVAANVVSEANDEKQLVPMMELVEKEYGRVAEETVADGGYNTPEALNGAETNHYPVIVAASPHDPETNQNKPFHSSRFQYDSERDVVICPQRQIMTYERTIQRKKKRYAVRVYRTKACAECPVRSQCTRDPRGRSIEIHPHHDAVMRQRQKRSTPQKLTLLLRRFPVAERGFAVIKAYLAFRRFRLRGLPGATLEWMFVCLVHNLLQIRWHEARAAA